MQTRMTASQTALFPICNPCVEHLRHVHAYSSAHPPDPYRFTSLQHNERPRSARYEILGLQIAYVSWDLCSNGCISHSWWPGKTSDEFILMSSKKNRRTTVSFFSSRRNIVIFQSAFPLQSGCSSNKRGISVEPMKRCTTRNKCHITASRSEFHEAFGYWVLLEFNFSQSFMCHELDHETHHRCSLWQALYLLCANCHGDWLSTIEISGICEGVCTRFIPSLRVWLKVEHLLKP